MRNIANPLEQFILPSYQQLFQLVCLADFIGCEQILMMVASRLGVAVLAINNANPIRTVRGVIQSWYRAHSQFLKATFDKGNKCAKCDWMLVRGRTSLERLAFCTTPRCGYDEHLSCSAEEVGHAYRPAQNSVSHTV